MTEQVKLLFESLNNIDGSLANMETVARFERILRSLECEKITLLVNIDASVNSMKNYVERL